MAKGKQAAAAANRRLDLAMEHIDRLTDQLAEAKARAKIAETDHALVEKLQADSLELRRRLEATGAAQAEAVREAVADAEDRFGHLVSRLQQPLDRLFDAAEGRVGLTSRDWDALQAVLGNEWLASRLGRAQGIDGGSRTMRRNLSNGSVSGCVDAVTEFQNALGYNPRGAS